MTETRGRRRGRRMFGQDNPTVRRPTSATLWVLLLPLLVPMQQQEHPEQQLSTPRFTISYTQASKAAVPCETAGTVAVRADTRLP